MGSIIWQPFYERFLWKGMNPFIAKIFFSAILGGSFLISHLLIMKEDFFNDWSWFLAALIIASMLCVYYATHTLRSLLPEIEARLGKNAKIEFKQLLIDQLSDKKLIRTGIILGTVNCLFAYFFGFPYKNLIAANISLTYGYFIAGFVSGMAIQGIYGITILMHRYADTAKESYDFTASDQCGGTGYLGIAIYIFSLVSLIVSIMISVYILKTDWGNEEKNYFRLIQWFWIIFPYVVSICALIAPAIPINMQLRQYKREEDSTIQEKINEIRQQLQHGGLVLSEVKTLREEYAYQLSIRDKLHGMRTWPFSTHTNIEYLIAIIGGICTSISSSYEELEKIIPKQ